MPGVGAGLVPRVGAAPVPRVGAGLGAASGAEWSERKGPPLFAAAARQLGVVMMRVGGGAA